MNEIKWTGVCRDTRTFYIDCLAPEELFENEWDNLSDATKAWYDENHLPCEGTGNIGLYCGRCIFAHVDEE